jgi:hypothetical protein
MTAPMVNTAMKTVSVSTKLKTVPSKAAVVSITVISYQKSVCPAVIKTNNATMQTKPAISQLTSVNVLAIGTRLKIVIHAYRDGEVTTVKYMSTV